MVQFGEFGSAFNNHFNNDRRAEDASAFIEKLNDNYLCNTNITL